MTHPFVTVIIPVFKDAQRLKRCLAALDQQTNPRDRYEVIVVENSSDLEQAIPAVFSIVSLE